MKFVKYEKLTGMRILPFARSLLPQWKVGMVLVVELPVRHYEETCMKHYLLRVAEKTKKGTYYCTG